MKACREQAIDLVEDKADPMSKTISRKTCHWSYGFAVKRLIYWNINFNFSSSSLPSPSTGTRCPFFISSLFWEINFFWYIFRHFPLWMIDIISMPLTICLCRAELNSFPRKHPSENEHSKENLWWIKLCDRREKTFDKRNEISWRFALASSALPSRWRRICSDLLIRNNYRFKTTIWFSFWLTSFRATRDVNSIDVRWGLSELTGHDSWRERIWIVLPLSPCVIRSSILDDRHFIPKRLV